MGDNAGTATVLVAGRSANDAYDLTIKFEFYFRLWKRARPLADLGWMVTCPLDVMRIVYKLPDRYRHHFRGPMTATLPVWVRQCSTRSRAPKTTIDHNTGGVRIER